MIKKLLRKKLERLLEREQRESDADYIARLIIRYCKEHDIIGLSTPTLRGIVEFKFKENKK